MVLISPLLLLLYLFHVICALVYPVWFTRWFIFNVPGASWQQGDLKSEQVQEEHKSAPVLSRLPYSGELVEHDFRNDADNDINDNLKEGQEILIVSYNIFLAQNLKEIIAEFSDMEQTPDVIFLQEDNIYKLSRSQNSSSTQKDGKSRELDDTEAVHHIQSFHHAGGAIAQALKMSCIFVNAHYRGGDEKNGTGVYGMAILSRFKLRNTTALKCISQPWIVNKMTTWLNGERHFPYAEIGVGSNAIALSSVHLPSVGRFREKIQMIVNLSKQMKDLPTSTGIEKQYMPSIIGGDMNTAPTFFRWVLPFGSNDLFCTIRSETSLFRKFIDTINYFDPFSSNDGTFQFPSGNNCKLDWILLDRNCFEVKSFKVQSSYRVHNQTHKMASDHSWISVTCQLV